MYNAQDRLGNFPSGRVVKNGDGDGELQVANSNGDNELLILWQHLAVAGLIAGEYDGTTNQPGVGVPVSKYGDNIGLEIEQIGAAINVKFSRYDSAGTGDQGFLTAKEAYELTCRYGDCSGSGGLVTVSPNCISGGSINMNLKGRDCYVSFQAAGLSVAAAGSTAGVPVTTAGGPTTSAPTTCPGGVAVGGSVTRNCSDFNPGMSGTYQLVCRANGAMEINPDPASYTCKFSDCTPTNTADTNSNQVSFAATQIGYWRRGTCPTWMAGYDDSNEMDVDYVKTATPLTASSQAGVALPHLQCKPPGGDTGWNLVNRGQTMVGYCDTYCDYGQLTGNGGYNTTAYVVSGGTTPYHEEDVTEKSGNITVSCTAPYSDTTSAGVTGEATDNQIITCQPTAGAGYTNLTLNCQADCRVTTVSGWNATRMSVTGGFTGSGSPYVRRGTGTTLSCNAGYTGAATTPSCNAGGAWVGSAPTCLQDCAAATLPCGNGANCSFAYKTSGNSSAATCPTGYTYVAGNQPTRTCTDGSWGALSGICYLDCGATAHGATASCPKTGCSCGVASNGTQTCSNGIFGACTGGSCRACPPPPDEGGECGGNCPGRDCGAPRCR